MRELLGCFGCGSTGNERLGEPRVGSPKRSLSSRSRTGSREIPADSLDEEEDVDAAPLAPGEVFLGGFLFKKDHGMLPLWHRRFVTLRHG
jgi:hypothetical protein